MIPAPTINTPTNIDRYSVTHNENPDKKYIRPRPANRYTANTDAMYKLPKKSILFRDLFAPRRTDIIKIRTPIAQGLIESITAVTRTVVAAGRYASTAIDITFFYSNFVGIAYMICFFFYSRIKFNYDAISWWHFGV